MRRLLKPSRSAGAAVAGPAPAYPAPVPYARRYGQRLLERVRANRTEIALVVAITAFAAALRLWRLDTVPLGLHGDEAWTGLDARRVLHEGWIGPYVESALGQPTGPLYFTAFLFSFLPDTTFMLRFSMAVFGIATIPLAYLAFRSMFDATVAVFASLLLAVMTWHLHLTRTGFMVGAWPFAEMAVLWALFAGIRRRSAVLLMVAGALTGLGVYSYNAYPLFVPVVAVALIWAIARAHRRDDRRRLALGAGAAVLAAVVVALPMLAYIAGHYDTYRFHQQELSVTNSPEWHDAGPAGRANILRHRFDEWALGLATGNRPDLGDGLAGDGQPVVQPVILALAIAGLWMALWRWRSTAYATAAAAVFVMPLGALATTGDGLFRRSFGLAPFVALLAALPLTWAWERYVVTRHRWAPVAATAVLVAVAIPAAFGIYEYFGPAQRTFAMTFTFPYQEDAAAHYIASLPPGTHVYYYSDRWAFDYETMRFIAPDAQGTDRSYEYGVVPPGGLDYRIPGGEPAAFVFLGAYLDDVDSAKAEHPGGVETDVRRGDETLFRAYYVPGG